MIDVEPLIISGLDRLVPLPTCERANWHEVLAAAGVKPQRRVARKQLVAVVAVLAAVGAIIAATPVRAALGHGLETFSSWLTGSPGKPSSQAEQNAFDRATRSWAGFPQGTKLRRLVRTEAGGTTFTLYGFRGAGSLCLRLIVTGGVSARSLVCPPLSAVRGNPQPALVVAANEGVGATRQTSNGPFAFAVPKFTVTFGVVADGVREIELTRSDGTSLHPVVNGDTFLVVESNPSPVTHAWATTSGRRVALSLTTASSPFGLPQTSGPQLSARGPAKAQRTVHGGAIRWLAQREPRGTAVPATVHHVVGVLPDVIFHREIAPDSAAPERMVVSVRPAGNAYAGAHLRNKLQVCAEVVGGRFAGAGGCWPAGRLFSTAPFSLGLLEHTGGQTVTIAGLASDDVAELTLYLATSGRVNVPLHDNGYITSIATADYPARLVAYDSKGLVIGVKTLEHVRVPVGPQPLANARWHSLFRNAVGQVFVARSTTGGTCHAIRIGVVTIGPSCQPPPTPTELQLGVGWSKDGTEVTGRAGTAVSHIVLHLTNGRTQTISPVSGYILAKLPPPERAKPGVNPVRTITAFAGNGRLIEQQTSTLTGGSGTITRLSATSIAIGSARQSHSCRVTQQSPSLSGYIAGLHVRYLCESGVLSLIGRSTPTRTAIWADRTIRAEGPIMTLKSGTISLRNNLRPADASTPIVTCALTAASPSTTEYRPTETVQVFCSHGALTGINRVFR